jgi:hypothetical protein
LKLVPGVKETVHSHGALTAAIRKPSEVNEAADEVLTETGWPLPPVPPTTLAPVVVIPETS